MCCRVQVDVLGEIPVDDTDPFEATHDGTPRLAVLVAAVMAVVQDPGLVERGGRGHVVGNTRGREVGHARLADAQRGDDVALDLQVCVSWSLM